MKQLLSRAAEHGIAVHVWDLGGLRGLYDDEERCIYLNLGLTMAEQRSTLAHELGHAYYGHGCTIPQFEDRARKYAATLLVDPHEYARLERINPDQYWLADEFTVTPSVIFDYERFCLTKLRGVTYSRARMGLGQWAYRGTSFGDMVSA